MSQNAAADHLNDDDVINSMLGRTRNTNIAPLRIAEKLDVKTTFDEIEAVRDENEALRAQLKKQQEEQEKQKAENDFIMRALKAKGIL